METRRRIKLIRILERIDKQREYALKLGLKVTGYDKEGGNTIEEVVKGVIRSRQNKPLA